MIKQKISKISLLFFMVFSFLLCHSTYTKEHSAFGQGNIEETAKLLQNLAQYEIDHSFLISQCIDNVRNQALKDELFKIREECESNIKSLFALITKYGKEPPAYSKDFKGFFMQGYAAMRGLTSDQGAVKALHSSSQIILRAFEDSLKSSIPEDVKETIKQIYENKRKNLKYMESQM